MLFLQSLYVPVLCAHTLCNTKKFCELKRENRGIVEKAQETRFGMSPKYSRYSGIALESCFVPYVIVKHHHQSPISLCTYLAYIVYIMASLIIVTYLVANNSWCAV